MKKLLLIIFLFSSCAKSKMINGIKYEPYGLVNEQELKSDSIRYEVPTSNIVLSIVFSETFVVPGYIIGWELYEPKEIKRK